MTDILQEKAFAFALRIVKLCEFLSKEKHEFVLSRKILDSATNIGLFIEEGKQGEGRTDFISKYSLANKEAFKSDFLLRIIHGSGYISDAQSESMLSDCGELKGLLISSLRTARKKE